jgi:hypothetical protein
MGNRMEGSLYEQIITLLTVPPGNLVYHLVLAFSIAGTLPGALTLWQRSGMEEGRRMVIGLSWLLLSQIVLIFNAGLAQFFPELGAWMPVLDRAAYAFSVIILIWLWVYPHGSPKVTSATQLLSGITILLAIISGLWWQNQASNSTFNGTNLDLLWTGFTLVLAFGGGLLLILRRPDGYGFGLGMFVLLFMGLLVYLLDPQPVGNFPGIIRLTQIAAYPLLLTLPTRFSWGSETDLQPAPGLEPSTYENIKKIATKSDPLEVCQAVTAIVSQALKAEWCLMVSPPDYNKHINLFCGYDLERDENTGAATFDSQLVPVLSEALRQGRPLHLPAEGNIPDLEGIGKVLSISIAGSLLSAPVLTRSGRIDKALVLLSADSEHTWSAADQNYLADIAASLTEIFEYKNEFLTQSEKLSQSNTNLQNILNENEHLTEEINEIRSINLAIEEQIQKLQSDLDIALNELAAMKATGSQGRG